MKKTKLKINKPIDVPTLKLFTSFPRSPHPIPTPSVSTSKNTSEARDKPV